MSCISGGVDHRDVGCQQRPSRAGFCVSGFPGEAFIGLGLFSSVAWSFRFATMIVVDTHRARCSANGGGVMSLSNSWRILRDTSRIYRAIQPQEQPNEEAAAKGIAQDRSKTAQTEANQQTR
jgi:hypothetical protein